MGFEGTVEPFIYLISIEKLNMHPSEINETNVFMTL